MDDIPSMKKEALMKLQKYCAIQDRCHQDVRNKLFKLKIYGDDQEEIIADLISDGFLNEERYARSFARGKFRMNQWGRIKIRQALAQKRVSGYCINAGLDEIDEEEYKEMIRTLIDKLSNRYSGENAMVKRNKVYQALLRKGFESYMIMPQLDGNI